MWSGTSRCLRFRPTRWIRRFHRRPRGRSRKSWSKRERRSASAPWWRASTRAAELPRLPHQPLPSLPLPSLLLPNLLLPSLLLPNLPLPSLLLPSLLLPSLLLPSLLLPSLLLPSLLLPSLPLPSLLLPSLLLPRPWGRTPVLRPTSTSAPRRRPLKSPPKTPSPPVHSPRWCAAWRGNIPST